MKKKSLKFAYLWTKIFWGDFISLFLVNTPLFFLMSIFFIIITINISITEAIYSNNNGSYLIFSLGSTNNLSDQLGISREIHNSPYSEEERDTFFPFINNSIISSKKGVEIKEKVDENWKKISTFQSINMHSFENLKKNLEQNLDPIFKKSKEVENIINLIIKKFKSDKWMNLKTILKEIEWLKNRIFWGKFFESFLKKDPRNQRLLRITCELIESLSKKNIICNPQNILSSIFPRGSSGEILSEFTNPKMISTSFYTITVDKKEEVGFGMFTKNIQPIENDFSKTGGQGENYKTLVLVPENTPVNKTRVNEIIANKEFERLFPWSKKGKVFKIPEVKLFSKELFYRNGKEKIPKDSWQLIDRKKNKIIGTWKESLETIQNNQLVTHYQTFRLPDEFDSFSEIRFPPLTSENKLVPKLSNLILNIPGNRNNKSLKDQEGIFLIPNYDYQKEDLISDIVANKNRKSLFEKMIDKGELVLKKTMSHKRPENLFFKIESFEDFRFNTPSIIVKRCSPNFKKIISGRINAKWNLGSHPENTNTILDNITFEAEKRYIPSSIHSLITNKIQSKKNFWSDIGIFKIFLTLLPVIMFSFFSFVPFCIFLLKLKAEKTKTLVRIMAAISSYSGYKIKGLINSTLFTSFLISWGLDLGVSRGLINLTIGKLLARNNLFLSIDIWIFFLLKMLTLITIIFIFFFRQKKESNDL